MRPGSLDPDVDRPAIRKILLRLGASIVLFAVVLVVSLEVVLRLGGWYADLLLVAENPAPDGFGRFEPEIGRMLEPGRSGVCRRTEFTYPVRSNSLGFRDDELPSTKETGELRLWVLGDSITSGYGVREEDRFTERLEEILESRRHTGTRGRIRVVNSGIAGLGTSAEAVLLERFFDRVEPDAVLLDFTTSNDFEDSHAFTVWKREGGGPAALRAPEVGSFRLFCRNHLHFYHMLGALKRRPAASLPLSPDERRETAAALERIRAYCARREVPLTVALMTTLASMVDIDRSGRYQAEAYRTARDLLEVGGFRVVDTIGRFRAESDYRRFFYPMDTHPNAAGHARIAEILSETDLLSPAETGGS